MNKDKTAFWIILITGLGYFSDSFDVFLYNVMRVPSLTDLGLSGDALTHAGITILNAQVFGALLGGFFFGLLGDHIGRKKALLASVILDSTAMMLNAFTHDIELYMALRFLIGFGIAGEVGLGATLVAEHLSKEKRVYALAVFTVFGLLGVAAAAVSVEWLHWRTALLGGGIFGFVLLGLRAKLPESILFTRSKTANFLAPLKEIFSTPRSIGLFLACAAILAPNYFITGLVFTLSPEIAKALGITAPIKANIVLCGYFIVAVLGDFFGAYLTKKIRSRRKALASFLMCNAAMSAYFLFALHAESANTFYLLTAAFGVFNLWALASTVSVEQFPTPLRATVATSSVNLARFSLVGMNLLFLALKPLGAANAAGIVGVVVFSAAIISVALMRETHDIDLKRI